MKVYRLNRVPDYDKFTYPEDMKMIMETLESRGKLFVTANTVENLYYQFSEECCCGWRCVDEEVLNEFAEWLDRYEV